MRIAVPATGANLDSAVASRLGTCAYVLVVDSETMSFEAIMRPSDSGGAGAGIQMVTLALRQDARVIVARYVSPRLAATLRDNGIEVVTGVEGSVRQAVERYVHVTPRDALGQRKLAIQVLARSARPFWAMLPVLFGVVLLVGLFKAFLWKEALTPVFSGLPITDTFWGACLGSILAGNPINSYVIGAAMLDAGVSLFAITAMIVTWVSVGLVQLPAEIAALGCRFAVSRNAVAFAVSIPVALLTVLLVRWVS